MTTYTKDQIIAELRKIHQFVRQTVSDMPEANLFAGTAENWSPADYLKHLIIANKPFAKGLLMPREQMESLFGKSETGSMTYEELVAIYQKLIAEGLRAELAPSITPVSYRMPEGVTDVKTYLLETWDDANRRIETALEGWSEADLDVYKIPHPAIGVITVREMLYFTMYHNGLHGDDIARGA
ncbi:MAG: DinB family protein [Anaerolineae bacterium]|nr:DinB family protein [Anaerolineae bacterium]